MPRSLLSAFIACALAGLAAAPVAEAAASIDDVGGASNAPAVLMIHGGGWAVDGGAYERATRPEAQRIAAQGFHTFNAGYWGGASSISDALSDYDMLRAQVGAGTPICVVGQSAGGHLALMVAEQRDVACVISEAGATDLAATTGALKGLALGAFGYQPGALAAASPLTHAADLHAPALIAHSLNDPLVPVDQAQRMAAAVPGARLVLLDDGAANWVHRQVDPAQLDAYHAQAVDFMRASAAAWTAARAPKAAGQPQPGPTAAAAPVPHAPRPRRPTQPPRKHKAAHSNPNHDDRRHGPRV